MRYANGKTAVNKTYHKGLGKDSRNSLKNYRGICWTIKGKLKLNMLQLKHNRFASHEGFRHTFLLGSFPEKEVMHMGVDAVLTLMISFGMLIAFIMSDKNHKK